MANSEQGVVPMLSYEDGVAALEWLARAFGFTETARWTEPDGRLSHGEMETGHGTIMLAAPTPHYQNPNRHREHCDTARAWSAVPWVLDGVLVYVEDVDAHFARAGCWSRDPLPAGRRLPRTPLPRRGPGRPPLDVPPARLISHTDL